MVVTVACGQGFCLLVDKISILIVYESSMPLGRRDFFYPTKLSSRSRCQNIIDLDRQVMMSFKKAIFKHPNVHSLHCSLEPTNKCQAKYFLGNNNDIVGTYEPYSNFAIGHFKVEDFERPRFPSLEVYRLDPSYLNRVKK